MEFTDILNDWACATSQNCQKVKDHVYNLRPAWLGHKLGVIKLPDDKFLIYTEDHDNTLIFHIRDKTWEVCEYNRYYYIPDAQVVYKTLTGQTLFHKDLIVVFFKYTGLYMCHIYKKVVNSSNWISLVFDGVNEFNQCINYIVGQGLTITDNELGQKTTYYSFDTDKLMDRCSRWYLGEYIQFEQLGIKSDKEHTENWTMGTPMYEDLYQTVTLDQFKIRYETFLSEEFTCNICQSAGDYTEFDHCFDCIEHQPTDWELGNIQAYNLCRKCSMSTDLSHPKNHEIISSSNPKLLSKYQTTFRNAIQWIRQKHEQEEKEYEETQKSNQVKLQANLDQINRYNLPELDRELLANFAKEYYESSGYPKMINIHHEMFNQYPIFYNFARQASCTILIETMDTLKKNKNLSPYGNIYIIKFDTITPEHIEWLNSSAYYIMFVTSTKLGNYFDNIGYIGFN